MGFDHASAGDAVAPFVVEAEANRVPAGPGDLGQVRRVDGRLLPTPGPAAGQRFGVVLEGAHPVAEPGGQHLLELGQGPHRGLVDAGHGADRRRPEADGDGDRLLVIEEERGELAPGGQLVAAVGAPGGVDGVAELAEAVDVAAQRALGHLQPVGQLGPGPVPVGLQEGEEPEHAGAGIGHARKILPPSGQNLSGRGAILGT